jgi:sortase (surface protein transpeptidase)
VLDDRPAGDAERRFEFSGLDPGERRTHELHFLATAEEVDAPAVRVVLARAADSAEAGDLGEIGMVQPRTVAPRPRPGPARSVIVPKLGVRASVVPVLWEPPPFVIGQLQGTAHVSEGNTVLIGHLAGPQGDVFARLSQLRPGDEVTATSRGLEYRFVVSEMSVRPYDDIAPTEATTTPRLTLMTCTGQWSVVRQDYTHRLWVVAEPPELAQETIRTNAARAAEAAREAEAAAAARTAHEAEVNAESSDGPRTPTSQPPAATIVAVPPEQTPTPGPSVPASPAPLDSPEAAPDGEQLAPGIVVDAPLQDERVPRRLAVRGRRTRDADQSAPLWLLVRAEVEGSRWYVLPQPLVPEKDGAWQAELELGGVAGIRHEIRVGVADREADALLRRHADERGGHPLDALPAGFTTGARVTVERR